ncbi:MAG: ThiF family adenylyltransferase [Intestinibacter bartlettii]|uniref:ThiF family adenylyltransferase n=1 Tax=Intestinibacter bartlettii TaxID=261299 RepID=UPI00399A1031
MRFPQLDNLEIVIKILFSNNIKGKLKEKISHIISVTFIEVSNRNIETSIIRNGGNLIGCKKVLVIGCGSLGSYIVRELPKIGVSNLTIVDGDNLEYCNLSRHILGEMFVGTNKATAMCELLSAEYKNMKFNAINEYVLDHNFSEIINDESDYDLIIITTGNEDLQYICTIID